MIVDASSFYSGARRVEVGDRIKVANLVSILATRRGTSPLV